MTSIIDFRLSNKLALIPLKCFDYENLVKKMKSLNLVANDTVHTTTAHVTVHILDRNDEAPTFLNDTYSVTVEENITSHSAVLQVRIVSLRTKTHYVHLQWI